MTPIFPANIDEWYVRASFRLVGGGEQAFEMPAVFNDDGTLNLPATQQKLNETTALFEAVDQQRARLPTTSNQ